MTLLLIAFGAPVLIYGRKLYWFFVGAVSFMAGLLFSGSILPDQSYVVQVGASVAIAFIAMLLTFILQKFMLSIVGFLLGGYLSLLLTDMLHYDELIFRIGAFIILGLIGLSLIMLVFEWSLITLSAFLGSGLITQAITPFLPDSNLGIILFLVLWASGIYVQGANYTQEK